MSKLVECDKCDGVGRVYLLGGWWMCEVCHGEKFITEEESEDRNSQVSDPVRSVINNFSRGVK